MTHRTQLCALGLLWGTLSLTWTATSLLAAGTTGLVSVAYDGGDVNGDSLYSAISADGKFVAFATRATNIVPEDANGTTLDIVVRDIVAGQSFLASKNSEGVQADADSQMPALSGDGSLVVFESKATNLAATDVTPLETDIFLHDRNTGKTWLVSVNSAGEPANRPSSMPSISMDGRYVAFVSNATNLDVEREDQNGEVADAFVHDLQTGTTRLVSLNLGGEQGDKDVVQAVISGNGRYVALVTASSLVGARDTNGVNDVYLRDLVLMTTTLVSRRYDNGRAAGGACANPALDFSGQIVAFDSAANTFVDLPLPTRRRVYAYDLVTDSVRLISAGLDGASIDQPAELASISADGRYVCYSSAASNLIEGDSNSVSDVFLYDLVTGKTTRESVASDGTEGNRPSASIFHAISRDGSVLAFRSSASNLVPGLPSGTRYRIYFRRIGGDGTPPTIACPQPIAVECQGPTGSVVEFEVTAEDDSDPAPTVVADPPSGSLFPIGSTEVVCTATDAAGNSSRCTFQVTVLDRTAPAVSCPSDIRIETDEAHVPVAVEYPPSAVEDLCDPVPAIEYSPPSGSLFSAGSTVVVATATDASGNRATCSFVVTVVVPSGDTTPPQLSCPESLEVECTGDSGAVVEFEATAVDDTDPSPSVSCTPPSGTVFPFGKTVVQVVATDAAGNSASCTFEVTVRDTTPPEIVCPEAIVVELASAEGTPVEFEIQALDACGTVSWEAQPPSGSVFPLGTHAVQVTATDAAGNSSSCNFEVKVQDSTAPEIVCPEGIVVPCTSSSGALVEFEIEARDPSEVTIQAEPPSGSVFPPGTTVVQITATDPAGNAAVCTFEVIVNGEQGVFVRADADRDGRINITDAIYVLDYLFRGGDEPACLDAADCDDDGRVNITDAVFLLRYLFLGGDPIPPPAREEPGTDPTEDAVTCEGPIC